MLAIVAILAGLAIREMNVRSRHARHTEAVTEIAEIFDSVAAYFHERRPSRSGGEAPHRCPHPPGRPAGGETKFTPQMDVVCTDLSTGACVPGDGVGPGEYALTEWTNEPMWISLGRVKTTPHYFHYRVKTVNTIPDAYGGCMFTITAQGDDPDDPCNEFRRVGYASVDGVIAGPLEGCAEALLR